MWGCTRFASLEVDCLQLWRSFKLFYPVHLSFWMSRTWYAHTSLKLVSYREWMGETTSNHASPYFWALEMLSAQISSTSHRLASQIGGLLYLNSIQYFSISDVYSSINSFIILYCAGKIHGCLRHSCHQRGRPTAAAHGTIRARWFNVRVLSALKTFVVRSRSDEPWKKKWTWMHIAASDPFMSSYAALWRPAVPPSVCTSWWRLSRPAGTFPARMVCLKGKLLDGFKIDSRFDTFLGTKNIIILAVTLKICILCAMFAGLLKDGIEEVGLLTVGLKMHPINMRNYSLEENLCSPSESSVCRGENPLADCAVDLLGSFSQWRRPIRWRPYFQWKIGTCFYVCWIAR